MISRSFVGCVVVLGILYAHAPSWSADGDCAAPAPVRRMPQSTRWIGGCEGGHWFYALRKGAGVYFIRIFDDATGELLWEDAYRRPDDCRSWPTSREDMLEAVSRYDGGNITLATIGAGGEDRCDLQPEHGGARQLFVYTRCDGAGLGEPTPSSLRDSRAAFQELAQLLRRSRVHVMLDEVSERCFDYKLVEGERTTWIHGLRPGRELLELLAAFYSDFEEDREARAR